jgi:PAS domain S-box-containing protein
MPMRHGDTLVGFVKIMRDRTESSLAEERFRRVVQSEMVGILFWSKDGAITDANDTFLKMLGYSRSELEEGRLRWTDMTPPEFAELDRNALHDLRDRGICAAFEKEYLRKDGTRLPILIGAAVLGDGAEDGVAFVADMTERKRLEEDLQRNAAQLLDADRRKNEFLATLAHELRNPLAPIRNAVQLLRMKAPDIPELQWARDVIDRQIQHMTRLIDDLMDVSRISRGKIDLKRERVALATVIRGAVETSRPLIEQSGHKLTVSLPPEAIYLDADLIRLAQAFANLLNNAAKYTERGGTIDLTARLQSGDVIVSVKDSGIGIPREELRSVFDLFSQVQGGLERAQGGLGIGLSLVKRLVEMHGGTVDALSEGTGRGSEFIVRLPLVLEQVNATGDHDRGEEETSGSSLRILIVDDNRDAADSVGLMLQSTGNEICVAYDGEDAVRAADRFRPQVVLLDIGLPKLNGYEACRRIRQQPWGRNMVFIAVTGWGQDDDKRKAEDAGFDRHMVKPVDPHNLIKLLGSLPSRQAD